MMTPDLENPKAPSISHERNPFDDDDLEVVIDITSGDDLDDDELDDELERGGRGYVTYELDDEDTAPRSA